MSVGSSNARFGAEPAFVHDKKGSRTRVGPLGVAAMGFAGYTGIMALLERRMRHSGGPGIIPFELAGSAFRAEQIMTAWGYDGQRAARWSLRLDFGYMLTYGALLALAMDRLRRKRGHPTALPLLVVPAVAADAIEGIYLFRVLAGRDIAASAARARMAAVIKFGILSLAMAYILGFGAIAVRGSNRPVRPRRS